MRRADHSSRGVLPTVLRRCVWSRNIKNGCFIYIYDISRLRVNVPIVLKSGNLNLLEPSGSVQACNGIVLLLCRSIMKNFSCSFLGSNLMPLYKFCLKFTYKTICQVNQRILCLWCQTLKYSFAKFLLRLTGTVVVASHIGRSTNCHITFIFITSPLLFGFIYLFYSLKISGQCVYFGISVMQNYFYIKFIAVRSRLLQNVSFSFNKWVRVFQNQTCNRYYLPPSVLSSTRRSYQLPLQPRLVK